MAADTGIVIIQAQTRLMVTPHRTAERRFSIPTPIMDPVMVCVVDTGIPREPVPKSVNV
jgi:hypothetical protein